MNRPNSDEQNARIALRSAYARFKGLERAALGESQLVGHQLVMDFNSILSSVAFAMNEDIGTLAIPADWCKDYGIQQDSRIEKTLFLSRINQAISLLEYVYHISEDIVEIGALFNAIKDEKLRERCADLLSAPSNFDRAINQATQILEARIRAVASPSSQLVGANLVNEFVKARPEESRIVISDDAGEQRGAADLMRGMVGAYRNPSHHFIHENVTREDALKICCFIDILISLVNNAKIQ